jgi:hypothetical protein
MTLHRRTLHRRTRHRGSRWLAALIGCAALAVATAACGSASGAANAKASTTTTQVKSTPTTVHKTNPYYDSGSTVTITPTGFQPKELIALVKVPLTFVNHTSTVEQVQFEHSRGADGQLIRSSPIPPGGHWSYTPQTWESATYHSIERPALRGQIQIQPPAEP